MKPAPFVHHAPRTVDEAVATLAEFGHDGKILAGGQSLVPILNMRLATPGHIVDINRVAGLDAIEVSSASVRVGALVRHTALERSEEAYAASPVLREALGYVAHPVIRNRGTTVGSLAHADAAGELPAVLALTDGYVEAVGPAGARDIHWPDFFRGPLETALGHDELAVAARFGRFAAGSGTAFEEVARRHGDYALAGVAVALTVTDGVVTGARASFVSVTEVPSVLDLGPVLGEVTAEPASAAWVAAVDAAAEAARGHVEPESDIHATAEYRRMLAGELTRRALRRAVERATDHPAPNAAFGAESGVTPMSSTPNAAFGQEGRS
ncbi:xanthine dehydrogenase family protein subunit M [Intrasporangium mesophilum]